MKKLLAALMLFALSCSPSYANTESFKAQLAASSAQLAAELDKIKAEIYDLSDKEIDKLDSQELVDSTMTVGEVTVLSLEEIELVVQALHDAAESIPSASNPQ